MRGWSLAISRRPRQQSVVQRPLELELRADLVQDEAEELVAHGPSAQEARVAASHLARARSARREGPPPPDQAVHLVEQERHLLDLVQDDQPRLAQGRELLPQRLDRSVRRGKRSVSRRSFHAASG